MLSDLTAKAIPRSVARDRLRAATHDVHMRLHRHKSFMDLAEGTIELMSYTSLLARLYGFHLPLEQALVQASSSLGIEIDMDSRRRAHRLRHDLQAMEITETQIEALPRIVTLPPLTTCGRLVGALYVREGSTLGGRVLARQLDRFVGSGSMHGRLFLAGGPGEPRLWQRCCALVEQIAADGHLDGMIASAINTFVALETWLTMDQP